MSIDSALHRRVVDRFHVLQHLVKEKLGADISIPAIKYRLRGTAAGRINTASAVVDFNPVLLRHNVEEYIEHTVAHEYAHHVVHQLHGEVQFAHGQQWQGVMRVIGLPPRITHSYDTSMLNPVFLWDCGCTKHQMSRGQHKALIEGRHKYDCNTCGQPLTKYVSA